MSNSNTGYAHFVLFRIIHPYFVQYNDLFCLFVWFNLFLSVFSLWLIRIQTSIYFLFHQLNSDRFNFHAPIVGVINAGNHHLKCWTGYQFIYRDWCSFTKCHLCASRIDSSAYIYSEKADIISKAHSKLLFYIYLLNIDYIFHLLTKVSFRFSSSFLVSRILSY